MSKASVPTDKADAWLIQMLPPTEAAALENENAVLSHYPWNVSEYKVRRLLAVWLLLCGAVVPAAPARQRHLVS